MMDDVTKNWLCAGHSLEEQTSLVQQVADAEASHVIYDEQGSVIQFYFFTTLFVRPKKISIGLKLEEIKMNMVNNFFYKKK